MITKKISIECTQKGMKKESKCFITKTQLKQNKAIMEEIRNKTRCDIQKINKIAKVIPSLSVITSNTNGLNYSIKMHRLEE